MRFRSSILALVALAAASSITASCVSDMESPAIIASSNVSASDASDGMGGEGEPCYGNGSCDVGLACFSKICVNASSDAASLTNDAAPAPAMLGDGTFDASADAAIDGDASDAGDPCVTGVSPHFVTGCSPGTYACAPHPNAPCASTPAECEMGHVYQCFSKSDCGGMMCCIQNPNVTGAGTCPLPLAMPTQVMCTGGGAPNGCTAAADLPVCITTADCKGTDTCRPARFQGDLGDYYVIGICMQ